MSTTDEDLPQKINTQVIDDSDEEEEDDEVSVPEINEEEEEVDDDEPTMPEFSDDDEPMTSTGEEDAEDDTRMDPTETGRSDNENEEMPEDGGDIDPDDSDYPTPKGKKNAPVASKQQKKKKKKKKPTTPKRSKQQQKKPVVKKKPVKSKKKKCSPRSQQSKKPRIPLRKKLIKRTPYIPHQAEKPSVLRISNFKKLCPVLPQKAVYVNYVVRDENGDAQVNEKGVTIKKKRILKDTIMKNGEEVSIVITEPGLISNLTSDGIVLKGGFDQKPLWVDTKRLASLLYKHYLRKEKGSALDPEKKPMISKNAVETLNKALAAEIFRHALIAAEATVLNNRVTLQPKDLELAQYIPRPLNTP